MWKTLSISKIFLSTLLWASASRHFTYHNGHSTIFWRFYWPTRWLSFTPNIFQTLFYIVHILNLPICLLNSLNKPRCVSASPYDAFSADALLANITTHLFPLALFSMHRRHIPTQIIKARSLSIGAFTTKTLKFL